MSPNGISITPREKEVMLLLAHGLSSRKIAREMGISFHTVESFRKKLLQKFCSQELNPKILNRDYLDYRNEDYYSMIQMQLNLDQQYVLQHHNCSQL